MQLHFITQIDVVLQESKVKSIQKVMDIYFGLMQINLLKDYLLPDDSRNKTARKNHIDNFSSQQ
jgi:hypothetical protein